MDVYVGCVCVCVMFRNTKKRSNSVGIGPINKNSNPCVEVESHR